MNNIIDTSPGSTKTREWAFVLFLLVGTLSLTELATAQVYNIWHSFNSGFANSKNASSSIFSVIGQPFMGDISGNGIVLKSGFGGLHSILTSVKNSEEKIPHEYTLSQNYPNPFNPSTTIAFGIPEASRVSLKIFDIIGRDVATIVNEDLLAGFYRTTFTADHLSSGVYFYRLIAERKNHQSSVFIQTKKLLLLR